MKIDRMKNIIIIDIYIYFKIIITYLFIDQIYIFILMFIYFNLHSIDVENTLKS
jgi:hypothetical protein